MENLRDANQLVALTATVEKMIYTNVALPSQVFKTLQAVRFMPFDVVLRPEFFEGLVRCLAAHGQSKFFLLTVSPTIVEQIRDFHSGGCFIFNVSDSSAEYLATLHHYPIESRADGLAYSADRFLMSSMSGNWAVFADRDSDLAMVGFASPELRGAFERIFSDHIFENVEEAAKFGYAESGRVELERELIRNYG